MKIKTLALAAILAISASSIATAQSSMGGTAAGGGSAVGGQGTKGEASAHPSGKMMHRTRHHHKRMMKH